MELYDIKYKKVIPLPDLNEPRHSLSSLSFEDHCYVFSHDSIEHMVINPWWKSMKGEKSWYIVKLKMPKILKATLLKK